jgi:hypothetical protein
MRSLRVPEWLVDREIALRRTAATIGERSLVEQGRLAASATAPATRIASRRPAVQRPAALAASPIGDVIAPESRRSCGTIVVM